jgi:methionyl-tRNA synthetase
MANGFLADPMIAVLLFALIVWSAVWKGIALWKAGRNNQIAWFVFMFIINSAGLLPIVYLLFFQKKKK